MLDIAIQAFRCEKYLVEGRDTMWVKILAGSAQLC